MLFINIMEIFGIIPAGGTASRMGKLPCSKEVFPMITKEGKIVAVASNLLRYYRLAGISKVFFILRKGKWDIPEYYGDGSDFGVHISYLMMNLPFGAPFTINQVYPFLKNEIIALGFPDIIFEPEDAFLHLKSKLLSVDADIVLGIVPSSNCRQSDMIEFDDKGNILNLIIKQSRPDLLYGWFIALWRPSFSEFMDTFLERLLKTNTDGRIRIADGSSREAYVGDVIQDAIKKGMKADYILFRDGHYVDIGASNFSV
jgi:glucose-1-phosphate thymidylyltransferase